MIQLVTGAYKGLPGFTRDHGELQRVTGVRMGYRGFHGVTRGDRGSKGLQEVTRN